MQVPLVHDNSRAVWKQWFIKYLPNSNSWMHGYVYSDLSLALEAALDGEGLFLADDIICKQGIESGALVKVSSPIHHLSNNQMTFLLYVVNRL
ncbi:hypothetical protein OW492_00670 [Psychromonas sp. 14N.309.X.WAT.B.A12]|uniref:hypothetical protein n=1 Tax=Psychromonas sp. 14N.309.X.WAT.B.A12 TaxID=2998322 RepID=UPI0025B18537|nr:hypothetical protein [Psychromonas sp. 14N.309.X.WAT.B.A12]MDN2661884.1 hypothetical protein [Psychromonas sp. 14N.309.X.WAT.B.A12]